MTSLVKGQPIKYRSSGLTEAGARGCKMISGTMTASEDTIKQLKIDPANILSKIVSSLEDTKEFMRAVIGNFSTNYYKDFDPWYRTLDTKARELVSSLGLEVQEQNHLGNRLSYTVCGIHSFGKLPSDFPLSIEARKEIAETNRKIDENKGVSLFTYGLIKEANNGYREARNFKLGDFFSWATFGGLVLTDPHYKYEVIPITKNELLQGLQTEIDSYEQSIVKGELLGAIEARKQFLLQKVYEKIRNANSDYEFVKILESDNRFPAPETGVYVLFQNDGLRSSDIKPFAVKATPRYSEDMVAQFVSTLRKNVENRGFQALEVPERALGFVTNPMSLELKLS